MPESAETKKVAAERDPVSFELLRPLDIADAFDVANEQSKRVDRDPLRMGASELGNCLRELYARKSGMEPDPGESWQMDLGIAERGHATEARVLGWLRDAHGENQVLQDAPLSRWFDIPHPTTGETVRVALSTMTDPIVIGDNLKILALHEIKSKDNIYFFHKVQKKWVDPSAPKYEWSRDEMVKVPLFMFQAEDKANGIEGASTHNLLQVAAEARVFRDEGRDPGQVLLTYVLPGNLRIHLTAVLSRSDEAVLSELAFLWLRQFYHFWIKKQMPPPLFTMSWQCSYCPIAKQCAEMNQKSGEERAMNPLFIGLNDRLERARKTPIPVTLLAAREQHAAARMTLRKEEENYGDSLIADLPVSGLFTSPTSAPKKGGK